MKIAIKIVAGIALAGAAATAALALVPATPTPASALSGGMPAQGRQDMPPSYATTLADCAACHTADGRNPFSGGLGIAAPMGTIYSTNITPDRAAGIGNWTLDEFRAALVDGVGRDGHNLYPAMPYDNYRHLSESDIEAIYNYLEKQVKPDPTPAPGTHLMFPFNQRWGLKLWKWIALDQPGFRSNITDVRVRRGQYLVEGPGHCGACHTPRTMAMSQVAATDSSRSFLAGGTIGGWTAPDLRRPNSAPQKWSPDELKSYLLTGRNDQAGVGGEMAQAIEHSFQYLSATDADALVAYLRSIGDKSGPGVRARIAPANEPTALRLDRDRSDPTTALIANARPGMPAAARGYLDNCAACHSSDARGARGVFPALAGNDTVNAQSPAGLIDTMLFGATMPSTAERPEALRMPGFAQRLSDAQIAAIATFLRQSWGNHAPPVGTREVADRRNAAARLIPVRPGIRTPLK